MNKAELIAYAWSLEAKSNRDSRLMRQMEGALGLKNSDKVWLCAHDDDKPLEMRHDACWIDEASDYYQVWDYMDEKADELAAENGCNTELDFYIHVFIEREGVDDEIYVGCFDDYAEGVR